MSDIQIIGFAGSKQAGKDTACNFLLAVKLAELGISESVRLTDMGKIEVTDILSESISGQEWMPFKPPHVDVENLFNNKLGKFIKIYSFANKLKHMCIDILGLKENLVFGSDEEKNTLTDIPWDIPEKTGNMTVREVLQHVGTDMFRGLDPSVWVNACLRQIEDDAPELALISDVRFENEVKAIQNKGGFVIGLTRKPYEKQDNHISEQEPKKCLTLCDAIIDNSTLSISEQNEQIYLTIKDLKNVPHIF
tara:strand:+ start:4028 stop:4777 length:750 start_codon:yes stop_codon:yes gene_type:complete